jgi:ribosomal protein S27AE
MQQTLVGCALCDAPPGAEAGEAHTWGQDERATHPICVDCAIQEQADPVNRDHHACDSCGLIVDALAVLTRFRVELGHLEGPLQLCERCSPGGLATYWTRDLKEHLVTTPTE